MFFELTDHTKPEDGRPHFGFLIAKNPASPPFERALGGGSDSIARRVVGRYLAERPNTYSITVDNDELAWMQKLKDANQPHYVSAAPFVVSPTNLKGIGVALKSALDGKDTAKGLIPEGEMARPRAWSAVLGPFALPDAFVLDVYRGLGLSASIAREGGEEGVTAEFAWLLPYSTSEVCTVILGCNQELFGETPLTEFLQKVLVGAYALTVNQHTEKYLADSLVTSLMEASKAWLGKVPAKDRIIQRLSQGSTDVARQWAEAIRGDEENEEGEGEADQKPQFASLHTRRHEVILREVPLTQEGAAARSLRVIDLGCGDGKLTVKILQEREGSKVLSIDADERNLEFLWRRVRRAFKRTALNGAADKAREAREALAALPPGEDKAPEGLAEGVLDAIDAGLKDAVEGTSIKRRFSYRRDNVSAPYLEAYERDPDVLVLSEVIEHLTAVDRARLVESVAHLWRAKRVILTTPNREYNHVWGLGEGEWRHKDHKIEYGPEELEREVLAPLRAAGYAVRVLPVLTEADEGGPFTLACHKDGRGPSCNHEFLVKAPGWNSLIQPSWVVVADRTPEAKASTHNPLYYARGVHEPLHLHESGYTVSFAEVLAGLCHPVYLAHREPLAYLAPTVPPVEFDPEEPSYLEHPRAAFEYYKDRGVWELVAEKKYMGSRITVVAFKDHEAAHAFGYPVEAGRAPLFAWSRQGYPFFDDRQIVWRLHESILRGGFLDEDDCVVLDGEFMPWSYKAGRGERNLITQAFRAPGQAALVDATYKGSANNADSARAFLRALGHHASEGPPAFVPFDCKLRGKVKQGQRFLDKPQLANLRARSYQLKWLADKVARSHADGFDSILQACEWHPVYLDHSHVHSALDSVRLWRDYCEDEGGEGFVYKPMRPEVTNDGAPVQPALKVRGRDYLRLIYGMHYLETPFFEKVQKRRVGAKRRLAMQENLLADRILRAFMRGERREKDRYVAAFLGADGVMGKDIDATL